MSENHNENTDRVLTIYLNEKDGVIELVEETND